MGLASRIGASAGELVAAFKAASSKRTDHGNLVGVGDLTAWQRDRGLVASKEAMSDAARYATSDDVRAAVSLIATNAAGVPLEVVIDGEVQPDHDLALLLNRGNPDQGGRVFWTAAYSWLLTGGEVAITVDRNNPVDSNIPNALRVSSGKNWIIKLGEDGYVDHYVYKRQGDGEEFYFPWEDVIWIALWNPFDQFRGLSPLASLRASLDSEYAAKLANRAIFENGYMTAGIAALPGASPAQIEQFKAQLDRAHRGGANAHRLVFTGADEVSFERVSLTPDDMQFLEMDKATTRDVAKVYGIPEPYLGLLDHATMDNLAQMDRALWDMAILKQVRWVCSTLEVQLASQYPEYEQGITIRPDLSEVDAIADIQRENARTQSLADQAASLAYNRLWQSGIDPVAAAREVFGDRFDPAEIGPPPDRSTPATATLSYHPGSTLPDTPPPPRTGRKSHQSGPRRLSLVTKAANSRSRLVAARLREVDKAKGPVWDALQEQTDLALARLDEVWQQRAYEDDLTDEMMAAVTEAADPLLVEVSTIIAASAETGARVYADTYGAIFGEGFDVGRVVADTQRWADETAAHRVVQINEATEASLREGIADALREQRGLEGVREAVRSAFRGSTEPEAEFAYPGRVENIAQTEVNRAYNHGADASMVDAGIEYRRWVYSGKPDSRHGPHPPNGVVLPMGTPFNVNGHLAQYPSADGLPPSQACSCGCIVVPATRDEYEAQLEHPPAPQGETDE